MMSYTILKLRKGGERGKKSVVGGWGSSSRIVKKGVYIWLIDSRNIAYLTLQ